MTILPHLTVLLPGLPIVVDPHSFPTYTDPHHLKKTPEKSTNEKKFLKSLYYRWSTVMVKNAFVFQSMTVKKNFRIQLN
jgi:hypothetical protein